MNSYIDVGENVREFTPGQVSEIIKSVYKLAEMSSNLKMEKIIRTELGFLQEYIEDQKIVDVDYEV